MKTISITELHAETGRWVRVAKHETIGITRHGKKVAELAPLAGAQSPQAKFRAEERLAWMPVVTEDSTRYLSEDRDDR